MSKWNYSNINLLESVTVSTFIPFDIKSVNSLMIPPIRDKSIDNNESFKNHQERLNAIGAMGEEIAILYLSSSINNDGTIEHVSKRDDTLGYDIKIGDFKIEVKTTTRGLNQFEISYHELDTANKCARGNKYKLFFIKVDENKETAVGYIFNNIFCDLNFQFDKLQFLDMPESNVKITPNSFKFVINDKYIDNYKKITLTDYYKQYCENKRIVKDSQE